MRLKKQDTNSNCKEEEGEEKLKREKKVGMGLSVVDTAWSTSFER